MKILLKVLESTLLDHNFGRVKWLRMFKPTEDQKVLEFMDEVAQQIKQTVLTLFENEDDSGFAMKQAFQKIDMLKQKEQWTYDQIWLEFSNFNFYLTTIDTRHLMQGGVEDTEIVTQTPLDDRDMLFRRLNWSPEVQDEIEVKRKIITKNLQAIYQELRQIYSSIYLEKWSWGKQYYVKFRCS